MADNLALLQRLQSLANMSDTGDPRLDARRAQIATGADRYAPSEGELLQEQLAPMTMTPEGVYGGTYETPGGYTGSMSRDQLREGAVNKFNRRLRALSDQYIVPAQVKSQGDYYTQQLKGQQDYATEQLKGQNAAATAAVPRTVNTNVVTTKGTPAGGDNASLTAQTEAANRASAQIQKVLPMVNGMSSGWGSVLHYLPSSQARLLKGELESLKANIMQDVLLAAKAASPTGASGYGQLSDTEGRLLQQALGGLDQANDAEALKNQLQNIDAMLMRARIARGQAAPQGAPGYSDPTYGLGTDW